MNRRDFLMLGTTAAAGCVSPKENVSVAPSVHRSGGGDPRMRGPFPIMTTPYNADGSIDHESLAKEALFVADSGCPGIIWGQSNVAIDLIAQEEKVKVFETLARTLQGRRIMLTLGCTGKDVGRMLRLARAVEDVAARYPTTNIAAIARPPVSGRSQDDLRNYFEALASVVRRPTIIQTWANKECPVPDVGLLVDLARRHPNTFGYVKEESGDSKTTDRMLAEVAAKPTIHVVYSGWGAWQWLYQARQCGVEGLVSERCAYAPLLAYIWRRMEDGDSDGTLTLAFALFRLLIDQRGFPGEEMRGYGLYYFKRLGLFRNTLTRQYRKSKSETQGTVSADGDTGGWILRDIVLSDRQKAELDRCYDDMTRFITRP